MNIYMVFGHRDCKDQGVVCVCVCLCVCARLRVLGVVWGGVVWCHVM